MKIETVSQAFKHLKNKKGYKIVKISHNHYQDHFSDGQPIDYDGRELIKLAKVYSSENKQETVISHNVKHFSNSKNRTKTRDILVTEDFDKLPSVNDPVATDDRWNWD